MTRSILLLLATAAISAAQAPEDCGIYRDAIEDIVSGKGVLDGSLRDPTFKLVDAGQSGRCLAIYLVSVDDAVNQDAFLRLVKHIEASRTDKQAGAGAGGSGSSSVVAQGAVARTLSLATEYGALTQSVKGQVITLRGNLAGIPSALVRNNIFPYCVGSEKVNGFCVSHSTLSILKRVSFGVSFDASRDSQILTGSPADGSSTTPTPAPVPVTFTAKKREVSAISGRFEIWNRRDVTSKSFLDEWKKKVGPAMQDVANKLSQNAGANFGEKILLAKGYDEWRKRSLARLRTAGRDRDALITALQASLDDLVKSVGGDVPDLFDLARRASAAYSNFFLAQDDLIDSLAKKSVVAFEYSNNRPVAQPAISNFRLIVDIPLTSQTKFVANGALEIYDAVPAAATPKVKRFRDAQVAAQLDHGLGSASILGPATLSIAAYYQYQNTASLLEVDPANPLPGITFTGLPDGSKVVFTEPGNIWLAQAKLSLAPKDSSVKIPISVSYSNRTELIAKPTWRAQVGVAYDFDSLFSGLSSKK